MHLSGKKIVLAVTGSIAAYKTPELVRLFMKAGAEVKVIITPSAAEFVSPLALATVSKHPVHSNVNDGSDWNNHVELGRWADAIIIAPWLWMRTCGFIRAQGQTYKEWRPLEMELFQWHMES